jgi:hypothetical protein
MTKERPILFSGEMVRAILDGRKSQTRRVAKFDDFGAVLACRHGEIGDRLWVREKWRIGAWDENRPAFAIDYCDGPRREWIDVPAPMVDDGELFDRLWQQSTDDAIKVFGDQDRYEWEPGKSPCRWRPSIHMPRWASRILLEITDVRIQRLQDITEKDAEAEGVKNSLHLHGGRFAVENFAHLWEILHGDDSWHKNPFVWVISFKRIDA